LCEDTPVKAALSWLIVPLALALAVASRDAHAADSVESIKARYPACAKPNPSDADTEAARKAHEDALAAFDSARYDDAIRLWTEAYAHDCSRPKIFLNMGQAYERTANKRGALAMYELYVERNPADIPGNLPTRVDGLRAAIKQEDDDAAKKRALAEATKPSAPVEMEKPLGVAPWIVVAAGGAVAVTGAVLLPVGLAQAGSAADECTDPEARTGCPVDAIDPGNSGELMSQIGQGFLYGGVGVAALGIVLELAANGERPVAGPGQETALHLVGGPTDGGGYIGVGGRF